MGQYVTHSPQNRAFESQLVAETARPLERAVQRLVVKVLVRNGVSLYKSFLHHMERHMVLWHMLRHQTHYVVEALQMDQTRLQTIDRTDGLRFSPLPSAMVGLAELEIHGLHK